MTNTPNLCGQLWQVEDPSPYPYCCCQPGTFLVVLAMNHNHTIKQDMWKIANFGFSHPSRWKESVAPKWGGAPQIELTESELYECATYVGHLQELAQLKLKETP